MSGTNFAIVNEDGVIENVIVIEEEQYIEFFHAKPLADGQGIGDVYLTPEEYQKQRASESLKASILNEVDAV